MGQPEQQTYAVETEETAQRTVRRQTGEQRSSLVSR